MSYALLAHVLQIYIGIRTYGHSTRTYGHSTRTYGHSARTYGYSARTYGHSARTYGHSARTYGYIVSVRTDTSARTVHHNFISVRTGTSGTGTMALVQTWLTHLWRTITQDSANISKFRLRVSVEDGSVVMVAKCQQLLSGVRTLVHTQNLYQSPYRAPPWGGGARFLKKINSNYKVQLLMMLLKLLDLEKTL